MAATFAYQWPKGAWRGAETSTPARKTVTPGLIIVVKGSGPRKHYTVTHEVSGFSAGDRDKLSDAKLLAEVFGYLLDWTQADVNSVINGQDERFHKYIRRIAFAR